MDIKEFEREMQQAMVKTKNPNYLKGFKQGLAGRLSGKEFIDKSDHSFWSEIINGTGEGRIDIARGYVDGYTPDPADRTQ